METNQNESDDKSKIDFTNAVIENISSRDISPHIKLEESSDEDTNTDCELSLSEFLIKSEDESEESGDQELCPPKSNDDDARQTDKSSPLHQEEVVDKIQRVESSSSNYEFLKHLSFPYQTLLDGKYFKLKISNGRRLIATCKVCNPPKDIMGYTYTNYTLRKHLKIIHGNKVSKEVNVYISLKKSPSASLPQQEEDVDKIMKSLTLVKQIYFDGRFFVLKSRHNNALVATCMMCKKDITGTKASSYSFRRHLRRIHGKTVLEELNEHISMRRSQLQDNTNIDLKGVDSPNLKSEILKQLSIPYQTLLDGNFFELKSKRSETLIATCQLCKPHKDVKGTVDSSFNFGAHLKEHHELNEYCWLKRPQLLENNDESREIQAKSVSSPNNGGESRQTETLLSSRQKEKDTYSMKNICPSNKILCDGRYFKYKSRNGNSLIATCQLCKPHKDIKGTIHSTWNLKMHFKSIHGVSFLKELNEYILLNKNGFTEKNDESRELDDNSPTTFLNDEETRQIDTSSLSHQEDIDTLTKNLSLTSQIYLDGRFFVLKKSQNGLLFAACVLCKKDIESNIYSNSRRFRDHLRTEHGKSVTAEMDEHISMRLDQTNIDLEGVDSANLKLEVLKQLNLAYQIILDGKFFALKSKRGKTLIATCQLCKPRIEIQGTFQANSNFRTHIKTKHGDAVMEDLKKYIRMKKFELMVNNNDNKEIQAKPVSSLNNDNGSSQTETLLPSRQENVHKKNISSKNSNIRMPQKRKYGDSFVKEINEYFPSKKTGLDKTNKESRENETNALAISVPYTLNELEQTSTTTTAPAINDISLNKQKQFNNNILNFFLQPFIPLNAVNSPEFWKMFDSFDEKLLRISEEDLITQIEVKFKNLRIKITSLLEGVDYVCTTTDLWSSKSQYYLAITCHWIDAVNFKRRSVVLACKRFGDTFNNESHTDAFLMDTFNNYNLPLDKIVSNVTKNFSKSDDVNENHTVSFQTKQRLPYSRDCYTSTLSDIATIDVPKAVDADPSLRLISESTVKKVSVFLSLASSCPTLSPLLADFKNPDIAKWNSIYDSISCILKLEQMTSFDDLFDMVKLEPFTDEEVKYLRDYVKCLHPLVMAFERLQSEDGTFQGFVLPTLLEMRKRCEKLEESNDITICEPILKTILAKSMKSFDEYFKPSPQSERATIASLSHPFFKEKWLSATDKLERNNARTLFVDAVKNENSRSNNAEGTIQLADGRKEEIDDFYFGNEDQQNDTKAKLSVELEALRYLVDERIDLKMLNDYPAVKRVFLKYNTDLSSSKPFEKLFPFETRQYIARYDILTEDLFEERVLVSVDKDELVL